MKYGIEFARAPRAYLDRLDERTQARFAAVLERLLEDPFSISKPLRGAAGKRSARVGGWRIVFTVDSNRRLVIVAAIAPRGQVYRNL